MDIEILGASGSMGVNEHTTCIRINKNILLDAGSGMNVISKNELGLIDTILVTHAHLDHIAFMPFLLDSLFEYYMQNPLKVYAIPESIEAIRNGIFNWNIWPDFEVLPTKETPIMKFIPVDVTKPFFIDDIKVTPFYAKHTVPATGYCLEQGDKKFAFTGDTTVNREFIEAIDNLGVLDALLIECAFPNSMHDKAAMTGHISPKMLQEALDSFALEPRQTWVTHLKPTQKEEIKADLSQLSSKVYLAVSGARIFL